MTRQFASQTGALGLDKIAVVLSASDVHISPSFECEIKPPNFNSGTGEVKRDRVLYRSSAGNPIRGTVAMLNVDDYNLSIKPDLQSDSCNVTVAFSAGAFSDSNLHPLNKAEAAEVTARVEEDLRKRGLVMDFYEATLFRADIAQNTVLDESVSSYAPVFAAAGARPRVNKQDFGGTGFLLGNKQWQLCLYDKAEEMREKGFGIEMRPINTLRPELRLMKARVICDRLGLPLARIPDLLHNWDALKPALELALRKDVLCWSEQAAAPAIHDLEANAAHVAEKRYQFKALCESIGAAALVKQLGLPAALKFIRDNTEASDQMRRKQDHTLRSANFRLHIDGEAPSGRSLRNLYRELEYKLLSSSE